MKNEKPHEVLNKLASASGIRSEIPNVNLAQELAKKNDPSAVHALIEGLQHKNKGIRYDCIKVLYEIGAVKPELIKRYANEFLQLLTHKDNRLQWGGMAALQSLSTTIPKEIFKALPAILKAADKGSVITKDGAVMILIGLAGIKTYHLNVMPLLFEQLQQSLPNQLPMYAERIYSLIHQDQAANYIQILQSRLGDLEKESKKIRIEKLILKAKKL